MYDGGSNGIWTSRLPYEYIHLQKILFVFVTSSILKLNAYRDLISTLLQKILINFVISSISKLNVCSEFHKPSSIALKLCIRGNQK